MRPQIKSPIQYIVQTSRLLEAQLPSPIVAQNAMRQMGQILFAPPNVKGWDGGKAWISTSTLLFRYNFANYLINGDAMLPAGSPPRGQGGDLGFRRPGALAEEIRRDPIDIGKLVPAELRDKPRRTCRSSEHAVLSKSARRKKKRTPSCNISKHANRI